MSSVVAEVTPFLDSVCSVHIASVDDSGVPHASVTPYVRCNDQLYVYVSGLAKHTDNLINHPQISILFSEDEQEAKQPFARKRLSFQAKVQVISRNDEQWPAVLAAFDDRFGPIMSVLKGLPDFVLLQIEPKQGLFVKGFGDAHQVSWEECCQK